MLYFAEFIALLTKETNRYYHGHLDRIDDGSSPLPDVSEAEMLVFLAIIIQRGHCMRDKLTDYWAKTKQFHTRFHSTTMKRDRYLHVLRFLHFTDNKNGLNVTDENSDRLWNMRTVFEILNKTLSKFYISSENVIVNKVIILLKGRVIFLQNIAKKHKLFCIKIYKVCDETVCIYMRVYSLFDGR